MKSIVTTILQIFEVEDLLWGEIIQLLGRYAKCDGLEKASNKIGIVAFV